MHLSLLTMHIYDYDYKDVLKPRIDPMHMSHSRARVASVHDVTFTMRNNLERWSSSTSTWYSVLWRVM